MDGWQPMETAPKDGTRFLVRYPGINRPDYIMIQWADDSSPTRFGQPHPAQYREEILDGGKTFHTVFCGECGPTRWHPLPATKGAEDMTEPVDDWEDEFKQRREGCRIVYAAATDDAPGEVWLEWSVMPDGSDPVLEDAHLVPRHDLKRRPVRYVRADLYTSP